MDITAKLLKELTEASGVSGYEAPVKEIVRKYLEPLGKLSGDRLGSLICRKNGSSASPTVMLAGHMDEIGFMVKHITDEGFIKFLPLGGWFDQVLLGQRVVIMTCKGDIVGVIGVKPPHLISREEREKVVKLKDMYIDIGVTSKDELDEVGVRVGDPVIPRADFIILSNEKSYLSKAFDDRVGVALMISVLQNLQEEDHPNTVYAAATVLEEVNLGGANTSTDVINPDVALILETGLAGDVPGVNPDESSVKLGKGPVVLLYDPRMVPNLKLRDFVFDTARDIDVPVQTQVMLGGTTDGAVIHLHKSGVPAIVIGVPARHIHSHSSILHREDYDWTVQLIQSLIRRMDGKTVKEFAK